MRFFIKNISIFFLLTVFLLADDNINNQIENDHRIRNFAFIGPFSKDFNSDSLAKSFSFKNIEIEKDLVINGSKFRFLKPPASNESGLLILPNHPALIDPVIIFSHLYKKFNPNILVDENQLEKPGMKTAAKIFNFILIPDFKIKDETSGKKFDVVLQEVVAGLK